MRIPLLILVSAALAAPVSAAASAPAADPRDPALGPAERLAALISRVQSEQGEIRTLEARFVQLQESDLLLEPQESRGVFSYAAPDRIRWEYSFPNPITLLIDDEEMTTWYRDLGRAEQLKVGRYSSRVLKYLGAGSSLAALLEYFDVTAAYPLDRSQPYRLELTPKFSRVAKRLRSMTLWVDPERFLPSRLLYVSGDGDTTDLRFEGLRINRGLPSDRFELRLPASVEVVQILDPRAQVTNP